jgi:Spy/CpxP family protein refolding chaperone
MTEQISPAAKPAHRRFLAVAALAVALGAGGVVAAQNFGPPGFGPRAMMMGGGGPMNMDPAQMAEMADRGVRHVAIEIDATPEQTDKLRAIARDLVKDLAPLRGARQQAAEKIRSLLTQPTVDKAAVEAFRAEQIGKMDSASKRVAQAVDDAADVLTAEQRQKLANRMPRPGQGPGFGMGGGGFGPR